MLVGVTLSGAGQPYLAVTSSTTQFRQVAISPDGRRVAYVEGVRNADNSDSRNSLIYVTQEGGTPKRITTGSTNANARCQEKDVSWSPDSRQIAFLSDCQSPRQLQLYVADATTGKTHRLTSLKGYLQVPKWSPVGTELAVLFTENATRIAGPTEAGAKDAGVVEEVVYEQRIALIDLHGGVARCISPADTYVYEYDWSPEGARIVYTAAKGSGDNNWWIAQLYSIATATGNVKHLYKPKLQIAMPRWSKDGKQIAFISGLMSDEGSTGGDIYAIPAESGSEEARDLTPETKSSPSWIDWLPDGRMLYAETVDGGSAIAVLNPKKVESEVLWRGDESLRAGDETVSASADGKSIASARSSWSLPPEVWAGPVNDWKQITHANAALKPAWGKAEKLHWMSEGQRVEGWLMYPADYQPSGRKYGLIVSVHGGPAAAKKPAWPTWFDFTALSSEGFFVLFPNPRGSFGAGEDFTKANVKDFGFGDLRDIMAGITQAEHDLPIDDNRLGIGGWSYGGYMTMWAVTQTHRFHAAVAGAGIANWQSYYGENLIDQWMIPYFGASVYDDPGVYARSSPITYIKTVETPTLIVVGDSDEECPSPQSYEFWHALKTKGVKTQLVVYPGEGHRFHKTEDQKDVLRRAIDWFRENLQ
jgi:dipeptidyl aminopeptidase/acylaminoacyl peptidase